jgi:hypothetical protein
MCVAFGLIAFVKNVYVFFGAAACLGLGALIAPAAFSIVSSRVSDSDQGSLLSHFSISLYFVMLWSVFNGSSENNGSADRPRHAYRSHRSCYAPRMPHKFMPRTSSKNHRFGPRRLLLGARLDHFFFRIRGYRLGTRSFECKNTQRTMSFCRTVFSSSS